MSPFSNQNYNPEPFKTQSFIENTNQSLDNQIRDKNLLNQEPIPELVNRKSAPVG